MGEDEVWGPHRIHGDDELPSRECPGPPTAPEDAVGGETVEHAISDDGLYLRLDDELTRLDDPRGLSDLGDRVSVVAVALCELAVQRLLKSNCACGGSS